MQPAACLLILAGLCVAAEVGRAATPAAAKTKTVKALGKGESANSYEHATDLAVRDAVRKGAGVFIASQTRIANFELIRDTIYATARGYITEIVGKPKKYMTMGGKIYVVELTAQVAIGKISAKEGNWAMLQALIKLVGRPNFIVEVEASGSAKADQVIAWIRGTISDRLEKLGLRAVYQPVKKESALRDYITAINDKNAERARGIKTKLGAPYGIYIKAFSDLQKHVPAPAGLKLDKATMNLQGDVVSRSTAVIVASKKSSGVATGQASTTAVKNACTVAGKELFNACLERILINWARQIDKGVKVEIEATGLKYADVSRLKKHLVKVDKIEAVSITQTAGITVLEVTGLINHEVVADAILKFDNGALEPEILGPQRVGCKKAKKPGK